jgi:hypothetical protein
MKRRAVLVGLCAVVAAVFAVHLHDVSIRQALLEDYLHKRHRAVVRIAEAHGLSADRCAALEGRRLFPLAAAFLTVESFATSQLAAWTRGEAAWVAAMLGWPIDLSFGPGRIRVSTARQVLGREGEQGVNPGMSNLRLVQKLLDPCGAIAVTLALLEQVESHGGIADVAFVREAAMIYNGQSRLPASLEAEVAARIYFELVYNLFQHYRFAQLATRANR